MATNGVSTDESSFVDGDVLNIVPVVVDDFVRISPTAWETAQTRWSVIEPLVLDPRNRALKEEVIRQSGKSRATIYRWLRTYAATGTQITLVAQSKGAAKGQRRLCSAVEIIIDDAIKTHYLTLQKKKVSHVMRQIRLQCAAAQLLPPGLNTVYRRIQAIQVEEKVRRREGAYAARTRHEPHKGKFPGADYPLAVVQMDHVTVDVELVDETYRKPVGRPYITLAIDVYSRMVMGFYLSFDEPSAASAGLCLVHAILPKESELSRRGIVGEWPCHGFMEMLHTDNAREFTGTLLHRACTKYGITPSLRPLHTPHMGGHIERAFRTFLEEIHTLPGTTLSNPKERGEYNSEKTAALTLKEFEQWFTLFLVTVYHCQFHEGIGTRPLALYRRGTAEHGEKGRQASNVEELQLRVDFMPSVERTVQEYGLVVGHIHYYDHVLRPYIGQCDPGNSRDKRKFLFRYDPRDISCVYFLDPESGEYHRIPYKDRSQPPMSSHEYREVRKRLRYEELRAVDEKAIFEGYLAMREIELTGVAKTKRSRRMTKHQNRMVQGVPVTGAATFFPEPAFIPTMGNSPVAPSSENWEPVEPYQDRDDGTSRFHYRPNP